MLSVYLSFKQEKAICVHVLSSLQQGPPRLYRPSLPPTKNKDSEKAMGSEASGVLTSKQCDSSNLFPIALNCKTGGWGGRVGGATLVPFLLPRPGEALGMIAM